MGTTMDNNLAERNEEIDSMLLLIAIAHRRIRAMRNNKSYWGTDSNNLWIHQLKLLLRKAGGLEGES